jgi:hypothetical protein
MSLTNQTIQPDTRKTSSSSGSLFFQPKLTVNQPNDKYEQEADSMADRVMRMANSTQNENTFFKSTPLTIQRKCQHCQDEEKLHRKESSGAEVQGSNELDSYVGSLGTSGQALPESSRQFYEPRFGQDFSNVRIHTDSVAAKSAQSINALAYTTGNNIVFNSGQYSPESDGGKKLMAHELTHVVQQTDQHSSIIGSSSTIQCKKENEAPLAAIQGYPMSSLLPKLKELSENVLNDSEAAGFVGGPRLLTAINAAKAKGTLTWSDFVASHNNELAFLPPDQINDIISFLGGANAAKYFKSDQFDGRFDGSVDPASGVITLFFRVKFELTDGVRFGIASPGTKEAEKENEEGFKQYKLDFKSVVEQKWSNQGQVKPACPAAGLQSFKTKVVVTVVDSGEHRLVQIFSDGPGRSNMSKAPSLPGNLKVGDNHPNKETRQVVSEAGTPEQATNTQITSTHEFGHAIGLAHSRCVTDDDNCYGVTAEERRDIMGAGDKVQVIKRGGEVKHDDFTPFERIGERWGNDVFSTDKLKKCNIWSAI